VLLFGNLSPLVVASAVGGVAVQRDVHNHCYDLRGADPALVQRLVTALPMVEERAVARAEASSKQDREARRELVSTKSDA